MKNNNKKHNQIFTKSYVIKRLVENKFYVTKLVDSYNRDDSRYWTVLINPNKNNIILTCIRNKSKIRTDNNTTEQVKFRIYAPEDVNILVETNSLKVLIKILLDLIKSQNNESSPV